MADELKQANSDHDLGSRFLRVERKYDSETYIGALVRLVREIPYLYEHGADLPDHQERIAAWLSEARALVGEVNDV